MIWTWISNEIDDVDGGYEANVISNESGDDGVLDLDWNKGEWKKIKSQYGSGYAKFIWLSD